MPRKRLPINQMNVVPYIDVMLVLLVIFMVTAPLVQTTTINLPQSSSPQTSDQKIAIQVNWDNGESYSWRATPEGGAVEAEQQVIGEAALIAQIKTRLQSLGQTQPKPIVVFAASAEAKYGEVMDRVDGLRTQLPEALVQLLLKKRAENPTPKK